MADISKIKLSDNEEYNLKDTQARNLLSTNNESDGDISVIQLSDNTQYNIKDAQAREDIETITTDVKAQVNADKDLINNGVDFIDDETLDEYSDKIEEMQDAYKKFIPIQTTSGTEITIDNSNNDKALTSIGLDGNTEQTTYTGKNLVPLNGITTQTINALTITNMGDGTIKVNGTANATTRLDVNYTQSLTANTTYTFSNANTRGSAGANINIQDSSNNVIGSITLNNSTNSFTPTSNVTIAKVRFYIDSGQSFSDYILKVQLEKGSSATSFEPYVGGTASPNPDYPQEVKVVTGENTINVVGKNLARVDDASTSATGYSLTTNNGLITLTTTGTDNAFDLCNGTRTGTYLSNYENANDYHLTPANQGTYKISISNVNLVLATGTANQLLVIFTNQRRIDSYIDRNGGLFGTTSFTLDEDEYVKSIYLWTNGTTTITKLEFNVQLEKGSTATTYEAYQSQSYPINLAGKNLFNKNAISSGKIISRNTGELVSNSSYGTSDYMPVIAGQQYTFTNFNYYYTAVFDKNKNYLNNVSNNATITIPGGAYYLRSSFLLTDLDSVMFEKGSIATTYERYWKEELCKIGTYKDYLYKSGDKWYKHGEVGKVVLNGSDDEIYSFNSGTTQFYMTKSNFDTITEPRQLSTNAVSNYFGFANSWTLNKFSFSGTGALQIWIDNSSITSTTLWKSWLESHNTLIYYVLATPTDTEITDETLISQLEAVKLLSGTQNNFTIDADTLPTLNLNYIGEANPHL